MLPRCLATRSRLHFPAPRRDLKDQTSSHLKIATSLRLPIHFHGVTLFIPIPASFTEYTSKTSMASGTIQMRSIFISLACLNSTSVHSVGLILVSTSLNSTFDINSKARYGLISRLQRARSRPAHFPKRLVLRPAGTNRGEPL